MENPYIKRIEPSEQLAIFSEGFKNVRLCERFLKS